jgi:protein-disulfide isomerase
MALKKLFKGNLLENLVPVLLILTIGLAVAVGAMWQKLSILEKSGVSSLPTAGDTGSQPANGKLDEAQATGVDKISSDDRVRGNRDAKVYVIEYSDLECPYCQQFHPTMQRALEEYGNDLAWVYRHFPLDTIHPRARPAAIASECVYDQGGNDAFWKFIDYVFENQLTALSDAGLKTAATQAGADATAFSSCFSAKETESRVDEGLSSGGRAGVTGTPGNFVINQKGEVWVIPGAVPYETLKITLDEALKS